MFPLKLFSIGINQLVIWKSTHLPVDRRKSEEWWTLYSWWILWLCWLYIWEMDAGLQCKQLEGGKWPSCNKEQNILVLNLSLLSMLYYYVFLLVFWFVPFVNRYHNSWRIMLCPWIEGNNYHIVLCCKLEILFFLFCCSLSFVDSTTFMHHGPFGRNNLQLLFLIADIFWSFLYTYIDV